MSLVHLKQFCFSAVNVFAKPYTLKNIIVLRRIQLVLRSSTRLVQLLGLFCLKINLEEGQHREQVRASVRSVL